MTAIAHADGGLTRNLKDWILARSSLSEPLFRVRARGTELLGYWSLRLRDRRRPARIIVAAAGRRRPGWISTDQAFLDLLKPEDWARFFEPGTIKAIVAEHVWEHLTPEQGLVAARQCFHYLAPGGHLRIAVPDACNPDPDYRRYSDVNGIGPSADDHKIFYDCRSLSALLAQAGFATRPLEWHDEAGRFQRQDWDPNDGFIYRSERFYHRRFAPPFGLRSLIVDGIRPGARG